MADTLAAAVIGHMVGDYLLQVDWMAQNKKNPHPGPRPQAWAGPDTPGGGAAAMAAAAEMGMSAMQAVEQWEQRRTKWHTGRAACAAHCAAWTGCVLLASGWLCLPPAWAAGVAAWLFATHYAIDRTHFVRWYMKTVGQSGFAQPPLAPWSVIVVDNVWHLVTLWAVWAALPAA